MAVDTKAYSGHQFRLAIAKQAAFGTENTTQGDFIELHLTNRPEIKYGVIEDFTRRANGSVVASEEDHYRTQAGGEFTIPIEGVLTKETAAYLLYGVFQAITSEGASTPYAKVFTLGTGVTVPSTPGFPITALIYDPSGENRSLVDCVISELTLSFSPGTAGGRITYSGTIYSGKAPSGDATATPASWTAPGTTFYGISGLDVFTLLTTDLVAYGWSLTVNNGAKRFGFDSNGNAHGIAIGAGTAGIQVTGELMAKYDDNTEGWDQSFVANGSGAIAIGYNDTSSSDLSFAINAKWGEPTKDFGNDAGVAITIPFIGMYETGGAAALVATVEDGVDRSW